MAERPDRIVGEVIINGVKYEFNMSNHVGVDVEVAKRAIAEWIRDHGGQDFTNALDRVICINRTKVPKGPLDPPNVEGQRVAYVRPGGPTQPLWNLLDERSREDPPKGGKKINLLVWEIKGTSHLVINHFGPFSDKDTVEKYEKIEEDTKNALDEHKDRVAENKRKEGRSVKPGHVAGMTRKDTDFSNWYNGWITKVYHAFTYIKEKCEEFGSEVEAKAGQVIAGLGEEIEALGPEAGLVGLVGAANPQHSHGKGKVAKDTKDKDYYINAAKELRDLVVKLKKHDATVKAIANNGFDDKKPLESFKSLVDAVYELTFDHPILVRFQPEKPNPQCDY